MTTTYTVPLHTRLTRVLMKLVFRGLFAILSKVKITGMENVPDQGPYLIAINHVSLYEAPLLLAYWPTQPEAVGAADLWQRKGLKWLAPLYGGIRLHRGQYDRQVMDKILAALRSGRPVVIAPEGGRSHTPGMRRGQPGLAFVLEAAQAMVVPVGLVGTTDDLLKRALRLERPTVEMHIGRPLRLPPLGGKGQERRDSRQRNVDLVMQHIAALLPDEYRGVYADCALAGKAEK